MNADNGNQYGIVVEEAPFVWHRWMTWVILAVVLAIFASGPGWQAVQRFEAARQATHVAGRAHGQAQTAKAGRHMANYIVSGAGDTSYNGTYTLVGNDVNGNPYYTMGSGGGQR